MVRHPNALGVYIVRFYKPIFLQQCYSINRNVWLKFHSIHDLIGLQFIHQNMHCMILVFSFFLYSFSTQKYLCTLIFHKISTALLLLVVQHPCFKIKMFEQVLSFSEKECGRRDIYNYRVNSLLKTKKLQIKKQKFYNQVFSYINLR